jgi:hypothetical protein
MSNVLRPVGPEPVQTYWVRRLAVIAVVVAMLAVIVALIANGTSSGSAVQALPPAPSQVAPETTSASPTPSPSPTTSVTPSGSASPTAARATAAASTSVESTAASPSVAPTKASPPALAVCAPRGLRPTLTGKQRLSQKEASRFRLSLINGTGQACVAQVTRENFELKIYSGSDRIWSTRDCTTAIKPITRKLGPEQAVEWSLRWNGRRSRMGCRSQSHIPRPGTYWATAQLAGAEPVQLRMLLVG